MIRGPRSIDCGCVLLSMVSVATAVLLGPWGATPARAEPAFATHAVALGAELPVRHRCGHRLVGHFGFGALEYRWDLDRRICLPGAHEGHECSDVFFVERATKAEPEG